MKKMRSKLYTHTFKITRAFTEETHVTISGINSKTKALHMVSRILEDDPEVFDWDICEETAPVITPGKAIK